MSQRNSHNGHNGLGAFLESMNQSTPPTFAELLDKLFQLQYTGPCTLHFAGGVPRTVVLNAPPVQVPLNTAAK